VVERERRRKRRSEKGERERGRKSIWKKERAGLPGPKKFKRPNLAISSFKKGQILKNEKRPNFLQKIC